MRHPRAILGLIVVGFGALSMGWSIRGLLEGAEEWRPGAHVDSILLMGSVTAMALSGLLLLPAPDVTAPIPRWRKALGWVATIASALLLVWRIVRMG